MPDPSEAGAGTQPAGVLAGIRVLDLSAYIAGPYACSLLADMGADVIKVEPPDGDNLRNYPSSLAQECRLFVGTNRGKRSVVIDLKTADGLKVLRELVRGADVFVHNFRPGVAERLGIGHEALAGINERLIYAGLSGYGEEGPMATRAGFDQVLQAMTGISVGQAAVGGTPEVVHGSIVDYFAASLLAMGVVGALYSRAQSGRGQRIGVSLLGAALCLQSGRFVWGEGEGIEAERNIRSSGVNGIFPTRDGHLYLQATAPHFWVSLCDLLGCSDLAADPRLDTVMKRLEHKDEIAARITEALSKRPAVEWERLLGKEVPCAVVRPIEAMFDHPQVVAQGYVARYEHPKLGSYRGFKGPVSFYGTPAPQPIAAPAIGQHTREVLREAGLDAKAIAALEQAGAVK